jgi:hypothetical protein
MMKWKERWKRRNNKLHLRRRKRVNRLWFNMMMMRRMKMSNLFNFCYNNLKAFTMLSNSNNKKKMGSISMKKTMKRTKKTLTHIQVQLAIINLWGKMILLRSHSNSSASKVNHK